MMDLNLQDKKNKEIVQLMTTKEGVEIDEEVEFKVFSLAKKLKNTGITKPISQLTSKISSQQQNPFTARTVYINFHFNNHHDVNFIIRINTRLSVDELIEQVFEQRQVKKLMKSLMACHFYFLGKIRRCLAYTRPQVQGRTNDRLLSRLQSYR